MKIAWLVVAFVALGSFPAQAQLHLRWDWCAGVAGSNTNANFDCDPFLGSVYRLFGTFDMPSEQVVSGVDFALDFLFWESADTPPFWQLETCNATGFAVLTTRPTVVCQNSDRTLCGVGRCQAVVTSYGRTGDMSPQRARMSFTIAPMEPPVTLTAGTRYFAFDLEFYMDNAWDCSGCSEKAAITWNEAIIYPFPSGPPSISLTSTDPGGEPNVSVNCSSDCQTVSAPRRTWGALKALYR